MEAAFWINLQSHYDMEVTLDALKDKLDKEVHPFSHAA
jgi:plasmid maintenance system antidote protein VapI